MQDTTLEQALLAYRVIHTPTELSWKQHWVKEVFSHDSLIDCSDEEKNRFSKRLNEGAVTIFDSIKMREGGKVCNLQDLYNIIIDLKKKDIKKIDRNVIYSTSNGERPIGQKAFELWNGFQVIDMDIKDRTIAEKLKQGVFERLKKYNWFLGVVFSSSGKGLHIYTKIQVAESDEKDIKKKRLLYLTNFRHKYSFVYLACLKLMEECGFSQDDLIKWMDLAMFKPQQGAFIGYDPQPLFNTHYFEDFIYVNFDNVEDMGHPDVDWVTYPDLKEVFRRWEWFEEDDKEVAITIKDAPDLIMDTHNKVHYKHFERWRLANTLVKIYGLEKGYQYLRSICSNNIKDKELQSDCITASRHNKEVDVWAVNRLNTQHGFKIKIDIDQEELNIQKLYNSIDNIENPTLIKESKHTKVFHINKNEYLGNIKNVLLDNIGRITLIEAGAGVGKTEMVKSLVHDGKKIMMVMPFTSTIKSKVEKNKDWDYAYGSRAVNLNKKMGIALTLDKFSHLNLMDIKNAGYDYIFVDESHLLFQSEYRPVMPKVIEMIRNSEVPIIMMSGTPVGETVFFEDLVHLKVIKDDIRRKEFNIRIADRPDDVTYHMCYQMAKDIKDGKRILFPTNKGTLYKEQIKSIVQYILEHEFEYFEPIILNYYKKSNIGEDFMNDINFEKTISNTQILMCSNYLSVGVDILDKFQFSVYFNDIWMPQEIEQFANRLRSNDLYIYLFVAKNDADGNSRCISKYSPMNLKLNEDELKDCHSIVQLCNSMIKRNPVEYKYNSLIASIIGENKFIEYNDVENKYYLNEIAFKTIYFERKYREYVQQLPVLAKGMISYGYTYNSLDLGTFSMTDPTDNHGLAVVSQRAYNDQQQLNTKHIEELMDIITEDRLSIYKDVLAGKYEITKGKEWHESVVDKVMIVKNIEVFEKVVPLFVSMSKLLDISDIKSVFEYCRNKDKTFNFAAIDRIKILINIIYNNKQDRLDIPIKEFMAKSLEFAEQEECHKSDIVKFINDVSSDYAHKESTDKILIWLSPVTMKKIQETYMNIFRCLINISHPKKDGTVKMTKVELLWQTKDEKETTEGMNKNVFLLADFLDCIDINTKEVNEEENKLDNNF